MGWLKRHFLLAIGGLIALGLLGVGTWYLLGNIQLNSEAEAKLDQEKHDLDKFYDQDPFPHRTNIDSAKRELLRIRGVIDQARRSFTPVPYQNVTGLAFKTLLDNTIDELHKKADRGGIGLPAKTYEFSFAAQKKSLKLSPRSFPGINIQLAEIKNICDLLFDAKISRLVNLRRVRLSEDDPAGSTDYLENNRTNTVDEVTGATLSPYQVEFNSFSPELAMALEGFYKSPNGFLVKGLYVDALPVEPKLPGAQNPAPQPQPQPRPGTNAVPKILPKANAVPATKGLETILDERLLKVILLIEVVKPGTKPSK